MKNTRPLYLLASLLIVAAILFGVRQRFGASPVTVDFSNTKAGTGLAMFSMTYDNRIRTYGVYLPSVYNTRSPLPLVIALHAGGSNTKGQIWQSCPGGDTNDPGCFTALADREKFMMVFPEADKIGGIRSWNAGFCCGAQKQEKKNVDDIGFLRALIDRLIKDYAIDTRRIFVTGFSGGAMMAHRVGCELSDVVAAIAPVAGSIVTTDCSPPQPVPILEIHGTTDSYVPFGGGAGVDNTIFNSIPDTMVGWANRNGCDSGGLLLAENIPNIVDDGVTITRESYPNCSNNADVVLYMAEGGGHAWPQGYGFLRDAGIIPQDMNANKVIWNFFKNHTKNY